MLNNKGSAQGTQTNLWLVLVEKINMASWSRNTYLQIQTLVTVSKLNSDLSNNYETTSFKNNPTHIVVTIVAILAICMISHVL